MPVLDDLEKLKKRDYSGTKQPIREVWLGKAYL